jgi:hypothetical protein
MMRPTVQRPAQEGLGGEQKGCAEHEPGSDALEGGGRCGEEQDRSRDPTEHGNGTEAHQALTLARDLVAEPGCAPDVPGPDANRIGDVCRERRIAQRQQQGERNQASATGHAVEDAGAQPAEEQENDV